MDAATFFTYFGIPTLFILLCMGFVGWIRSKLTKKDFAAKPLKWVGAWCLVGCVIAILLAIIAGIMNTDFVYNHASLVWPFCLSLGALDGHPSLGVGALVVGFMGLMNGLYYTLLAGVTLIVRWALPTKSRPRWMRLQ
jgi:uncharacterized membrane protein